MWEYGGRSTWWWLIWKKNQPPLHNPTPDNPISTKGGDDFGDANKRPIFRAKKGKILHVEKEKKPSIAT